MDFFPSHENPYLHVIQGVRFTERNTLRPDQVASATAELIASDHAEERAVLLRHAGFSRNAKTMPDGSRKGYGEFKRDPRAEILLPGLELIDAETYALPDGWLDNHRPRWNGVQRTRWLRIEAAITKCRAYKAELERRATLQAHADASHAIKVKRVAESRMKAAKQKLAAFQDFASEAADAADIIRTMCEAIRVAGVINAARQQHDELVKQLQDASYVTGQPMPKIEPLTLPDLGRELATLNPGHAIGDTGASYPTAFHD